MDIYENFLHYQRFLNIFYQCYYTNYILFPIDHLPWYVSIESELCHQSATDKVYGENNNICQKKLSLSKTWMLWSYILLLSMLRANDLQLYNHFTDTDLYLPDINLPRRNSRFYRLIRLSAPSFNMVTGLSARYN